MESAIDLLEEHARTHAINAPIHEAAGDQAQAERDRKLAEEYRAAARHLKAVES